nr:MAG TPA: hypothetical protein [Caudoviricetes sp.]
MVRKRRRLGFDSLTCYSRYLQGVPDSRKYL